ncbi:MAG TPA: ParB/RepB/Spo0J family partition protein [Chloroflexia bacterium]|nr:ParB/RepB/Spo0J family partition protein [Chloroflexia bacterium]
MPKRPIDVSTAMLRPDRSQPAAERTADISAFFTAQNIVSSYVPIAALRPNPFQPRKDFRDEELDELAQSMQQLGFFGTLLARHIANNPDTYEIAYGERRLRAAARAGIATIPVYIRDLNDQQMLEIAMAENILRADLNPLEEAQGLQDMQTTFRLSIRELAARLGKGKGYVEKRLYLLHTPADVQEMVRQYPETVRSARPLAGIDDPALRARLIGEVVAGRLASDDIEDRAEAILHPTVPPETLAGSADLSPVGDTTVLQEQMPPGAQPGRGDLSPVGDSDGPEDDSTATYLKRDRLSIGYRALTAFFRTRRVTYDVDTASRVRAIRDLCESYLTMWEARGEH